MADTMKFGPEWLRALSDGPQTTVPAPAPSSKFKLAEYRYGREEMLALFQPPYESVPHLQELPHIYVEETQTPVCLLPLSEEEERVMAQGVNSNLARTGRGGGLPLRGSRGGGVDRGRGRGRGRGETYTTRGPMENGDIGGGFGRPRGPNKDGWEEVGNRKLERGFSRPFDDVGGREGHLRYNRSMSSENWRDKPPVDDDDDGDWRKSTNSRDRWNTRSSWREPNKGVDLDRRNGAFTRSRGFENDDRGRRLGEPGDVPEWADDGADDVGTFDSSGAFVYHKQQERSHYHLSRPEGDHPPGHVDQFQERSHYHSRHEGDQPSGQVDQPQEKEISRPEKKEAKEEAQHQEPPPPTSESTKVNSTLAQQLPNGKGGEPAPGINSRVERTETPPSTSLPVLQHKQQENGISAQVASLVAAAVSAAHVLPSMPQGAALKSVVMDEKLEVKEPAATATSAPDDDALMWFYTDPQGEVQGPFFPEEMAQWFSAGYFTMNLQIKRGCDQQFQPLGELMKRWGHVPFLPGPPPPPILQTTPTPAPVTTATVTAPVTPELAPTSTQPPASLQPPTLMPSFSQPAGGADSLLVQQQLVLQHQILQLQMSMRQLQMQTLGQLQEQDTFKALDPSQQQQVSVQMMQSNPLVLQHMQQLTQLQHLQQQAQQQQQQQQLSQGQNQPASAAATLPQALQPGVEATLSASPPTFQRSVSQPPPTGEGQGDIPSIWGTGPPAGGWVSSPPGSVWDLDHSAMPPSINSVKSDLEKLRQEKEAEFQRILEAEKKHQEDIQKQQEELRRQTEALHRERERMEREKEELERQRQQEIQRVEEIRRLKEEEQKRREIEEAEAERQKQRDEVNRQKRMEEQRRKEEEQRAREEERRKEEERKRRQEEEEQRKLEEMRRKKDREEQALQEMKRQEEMRLQQEVEKQKQREAEKLMEAEAAQKKQQQEFQRQQQEALKRLQQQQAMQNMQLPSSANWARQQQAAQSGQSRPLAEIQHEEEMRQLQQQRERQEMMRLQEEHLAQQQQQQQQQQKSWASNLAAQQPSRGKSLAEIQEEQERQLQQEKQKVQQQQHHQAKTLSLSQAAAWGSAPSSTTTSSTPWSGGSVWGSDSSIGLWGSTPAPMPASTANSRKKDTSNNQTSAEFPALRTQKSNKQTKQQTASKPAQAVAPTKPKKEEEAVQRLFKKDPAHDKDEFTTWCEFFLSGMDVQIDIETFVSFLQAVESPYEVHDYVKNYLGEGKNAREFAKQFLEKRSHYKNKARNEKRQEEESIWGPAPALNPRETRGGAPQSAAADHGFTEVGGKSKAGKKKKKMQKLDGSSLLGFTVEKDPNRKNAGQIESLD